MKIKRGIQVGPQKVVLYGPEGIGKSTFGAQFPNPLFLDVEGGTRHIDVARVDPPPASWTELMETVREFQKEGAGAFDTLVLDTADWAERLCIDHVCAKEQKKGVEDFGYGKGYTYVAEEFGRLLDLLSQVVSAVLTVRCIHGSQGMPWHLQLKNIRIERSVLLAICRIGLPGAAQSALYSISNMTIQSAINGFGTVAVAAWSVYGKIDFLFWMTVSSFGIAVTTFAGQNFGARQYDRVRRGTMTCLAMTAGTTLCISLALYPSAQLLFRLFSSDDAVVAQGVQMMHYLVPVYMTYICIEIFSGALRGCGDVRVPTIITVFAVCIMRIVWLAVALPFKHELSVVEFSYPLTWITATVLFAIYYTKGGWMQRCIAAQNAKTQG